MGRLEELRVNAYLSKIARGYSNSALIAESLFPTIESELEKIDIFEFNREAFSIYNTERAIRANSNVISPKGFNKKSATLKEHDLAYPLDYREEHESKVVKLQLHATNVVTEGLRLKHEKACADLVQDTNNYATGNKILLSGSSQFTDKSSDPIGVIDDAKYAISSKIAQDPNTMVIGHAAFKALKRHPQLQELISNSKSKLVTLEFLKEIFEVENILVGKAVYTNDKNEFEKIWADNIILAYVPQLSARTEYDPAFAYTVKLKDGLKVDEYTSDGNKIKYVRATDIYTPFLVGPDAGYLIKGTNEAQKAGS